MSYDGQTVPTTFDKRGDHKINGSLAIVLSVRLRFTDSDYPFGIFKLF